ncbi:MAG: tetratricopeptide repeat protein [Fervidobacterium sp.]
MRFLNRKSVSERGGFPKILKDRYGLSENTQARIHRNIGEIYYKRGQNSKAIEHFEIAVSLNPKVGVKRLLDKLKMES